MKFIDSTFLIDFLRRNEDATAVFEKEQGQFVTTEIQVMEVSFSINHRGGHLMEARLGALDELTQGIKVLTLTREAGLDAGKLLSDTSKGGVLGFPGDALTAAVLKANGITEGYSANTERFDGYPFLKIVNYETS